MSAPAAATTKTASTTTAPASAKASGGGGDESLFQHVKRSTRNCIASTISCSKNTKEKTIMKKIEFDITSRKKKFGVDYLNLKETNASPEELQACIDAATADIQVLKEQIQEKERAIGANQEELQRTIAANAAPAAAAAAAAASATTTQAAAATATASTTPAPAAAAPAPEVTTTTTTEPAAASAPATAATWERFTLDRSFLVPSPWFIVFVGM